MLEAIWERNWLTNNGPLVNELELELKRYLDVPHLLFISNGTIAIQLAIRALGLRGEIITTPFSYVATTSSIVWENCTPVFADISSDSLNVDPDKIPPLITEKTSAILATHCFGNACQIDRLEDIGNKFGLKVIYDAAHCFGTTYKGKSIFAYGDVSTASFHATKLFHTVEGGATFTQSSELTKKIALMRNFGHDGPEKFDGVGINGKNSELHAAMGLCVLRSIDNILAKRKEQSLYYDELLMRLRVDKPKINEDCEYNYSYYPIIFEKESNLLVAKRELEKRNIYPRRYFYPSLSSLNYVEKQPTPISDEIASKILCLPLYHSLSSEEQRLISRILLRTQNYDFV